MPNVKEQIGTFSSITTIIWSINVSKTVLKLGISKLSFPGKFSFSRIGFNISLTDFTSSSITSYSSGTNRFIPKGFDVKCFISLICSHIWLGVI